MSEGITVIDHDGVEHSFPRDEVVRLPEDDKRPPEQVCFEPRYPLDFGPTGPSMPERWGDYGDPGQARAVAAVNDLNIRGDLAETLARAWTRSPFRGFSVTGQPWANRPYILRKLTPIEREREASIGRVCDRDRRLHHAKGRSR